MTRTYRYLPNSLVALALDVPENKKQKARVAVTVCNPADRFSRTTAKFLLDTLFDEPVETLNALNLTRNVFSIPNPDDPREALDALLDNLNDVLTTRATLFNLRNQYLDGTLDTDAVNDELQDTEINSVEDFDRVFYSWNLRADRVIKQVSEFAQEQRNLFAKAKAALANKWVEAVEVLEPTN